MNGRWLIAVVLAALAFGGGLTPSWVLAGSEPNAGGGSFEEDHQSFILSEAAKVAASRPSAAASVAAALAEALGIADLMRERSDSPPAVQVEREEREGDIEVQEIVVQARCGPFRATLVRPSASRRTRGPAVLFVAGTEDVTFRRGRDLARGGYLTLIPRFMPVDNPPAEFNDAFNLLLLGRTLTGVRVYEIRQLMDYLRSRDDVDPDRVGLLGLGRGSVPALCAAVLDTRVRTIVLDSLLRDGFYYDFASELLVPGFYGIGRGDVLLRALAPRGALCLEGVDEHWTDAAAWFRRTLVEGRPAVTEKRPGADVIARFFETAKRAPPAGAPDADLFIDAVRQERAGDLPAAIGALRRVLDAKPDNNEARRRLAEMLALAGDWTAAIDAYRDLLATDPHDAAANFGLAGLLADHGTFDEAVSAYLAAARFAPTNDVRAWRGLAELYQGKSRFDEAVAALGRALKADPASVTVRSELGDLLRDAGRTVEAETAYREAIRLRPAAISTRLSLADLFEARGAFSDAEAQYRECLSIKPRHRGVQRRLAKLLIRQKRWPEAQALCDSLLVTAENAETRVDLALCLYRQGEVARARREAQRAIASAPHGLDGLAADRQRVLEILIGSSFREEVPE